MSQNKKKYIFIILNGGALDPIKHSQISYFVNNIKVILINTFNIKMYTISPVYSRWKIRVFFFF